jgi:hypothetical protein
MDIGSEWSRSIIPIPRQDQQHQRFIQGKLVYEAWYHIDEFHRRVVPRAEKSPKPKRYALFLSTRTPSERGSGIKKPFPPYLATFSRSIDPTLTPTKAMGRNRC